MRDHSATSTSSWSARLVLARIEVHQLGEGEKAVPARLEAADDVGDGRHGVGTVGLGESVCVLAVMEQGDTAWANAMQYAALDHACRRTGPIPGHYRPAHAPHPYLLGNRDHLWTIPTVGNAEELRQGARGVVDGLLASEQLFPDCAWPAPHEVWVGERMVANLMLRSDLGGEGWFAPYVMAHLEEGRPDAFAVQDLEQVPRVGMARAVVEGQGDHPLAGTSVPEDRAVEPGAGREPFVGHEPAGRHPGRGRGQGRCGKYRAPSHGSKTSQGRPTDGGGGNSLPGVGAGMAHGRPASMREAAERAEWGLWAAFAASTILCL